MNLPSPDEQTLPAPRLARAITVFALGWYATVCVLNVEYETNDRYRVVYAAGLVVVLFGMQLMHTSPRIRNWPVRRRYVTLGVQAVLTYLPFLVYGMNWGSMAGPLAASALLMLPGRAGWSLAGAVVAGSLVISVLTGATAFLTIYFLASTVLAALVIWGMTRLADLVGEVHASRREMARMAVSQERLRFARDLHDLLGYSLSSITLKSELSYRLIPHRPERARDEVADVLKVSRQALADVRLVASGYREMSLEEEGTSAVDILRAADIEVEAELDCPELNPVIDTVLATVLREGVTNILRHSKAQHCHLAARTCGETIRLTLVNDGVQEHPPGAAGSGAPNDREGGSGIGNLHARLTAVGGRLTAGLRDERLFQLEASVPLRPADIEEREPPGEVSEVSAA